VRHQKPAELSIWDEDTGLVRFGVRELQSNLRSSYDPETGRWTSKEPLGFAGARNFYVYAGNDAINYLDVTGLKRELVRKKFKSKEGSADYWKKMKELAKEAFEWYLECSDSNIENGFRIDKVGDFLIAYTGSGVISNRENASLEWTTIYGVTKAIGHHHPYLYGEQVADNRHEFSREDKSHKLPNFLAYPEDDNSGIYNLRLWKTTDGKDSNGEGFGQFNFTGAACHKMKKKTRAFSTFSK